MIGVISQRCYRCSVGVLIVGILRLDDLVGIFNTLLIVGLAVVHRSTPEIDVGEQGPNGIACEVTYVLPASLAIGTRMHDIALRLFQVGDAALQHAVGSALRNRHLLVIVLIRLCGIRNIAERAHQIEVAEAAQGKHLSAHFIIVTLSERGVQLHDISGMVQHNVAAVDDAIERSPLTIAIGRQQVNGIDIVERRVDAAGVFHQFIGTESAPDNSLLLASIADDTTVGTRHHVLNVLLGLPEILTDGFIGRIDGQEVVTGGESCCEQSHHGKNLEYIVTFHTDFCF